MRVSRVPKTKASRRSPAKRPGRPAADAGAPGRRPEGVEEAEEDAGVGLHRAAHVAQRHQRPRLGLAPAAGQPDRLAAVAEAAAEGRPQVEPGAVLGRHLATGAAPLEVEDAAVDQRPHLPRLGRGQRGEILAPQRLPRAEGEAALDPRLGAVVSSAGRRVVGGQGGQALLHPSRPPHLAAEVDPMDRERIGGAPEQVEGAVEQLAVLPAAHQHRPRRRPQVLATTEVEVGGRGGQGGDPVGGDVDPQRAQQATESDDLAQQEAVGHALAPRAGRALAFGRRRIPPSVASPRHATPPWPAAAPPPRR